MSNTSPANLQGAHRFLPSTLLEQLARCHPGKAAESKENLSAAFVHLDVCGCTSWRRSSTRRRRTRRSPRSGASRWSACSRAGTRTWRPSWRRTAATSSSSPATACSSCGLRAAGSDEAARRAVVAAARCALALLRTNSAVVWENGAPPAELVWDVAAARERRRGAAVDAAALAAAASPRRARRRRPCRQRRPRRRASRRKPNGSVKLERCGASATAAAPSRSMSVMLLKREADGALDILGNDALGDRVEMREMPARLLTATAGVGVGELFALHVGSPQRYEYVWGDSLQQTARAAFCHAQPGESAPLRRSSPSPERTSGSRKQSPASSTTRLARRSSRPCSSSKAFGDGAACRACRRARGGGCGGGGDGRAVARALHIPGAARACLEGDRGGGGAATRATRPCWCSRLRHTRRRLGARTAQAVRAIQQQLYRHEGLRPRAPVWDGANHGRSGP